MIDEKALDKACSVYQQFDPPAFRPSMRAAIEAYEAAKASGQPSEAEVREAFAGCITELNSMRKQLPLRSRERPYLRPAGPVSLEKNHLDHIREKLRGAASDCNVTLQPDQVRYITKAVLTAAGVAHE